MTASEPCPGCSALLPPSDGPTHRYIGASAACWALYTALVNAGEPPLAPAPTHALIVDAYAAQHPGTPNDQAIQSVAVHLLALYGVLVRGMDPAQAQWIRRRGLREDVQTRRGRYRWLTPPAFAGSLTVSDLVRAPTPQARAEQAQAYVHGVLSLWLKEHADTIAGWYETFVVAD